MVEAVLVSGFCFGGGAPDDHEDNDSLKEDEEEEEETEEQVPETPANGVRLGPIPASPRIAKGLMVPSPHMRRTTVSAEVYNMAEEGMNFQPPVYPKDEADTAALTKVLETHSLFKHLEDRELAQVVQYFKPHTYATGDSLLKEQTTAELSLFHVILEGTCDIKEDDETVGTLEAVCTTGETEMMYTAPRSHDVVATSEVRSFCIDRRTYQRTLHSTFAAKRALYCEFLKNVKFLGGLSQREMVQLADCLEPRKFQAGEVLIECNAPPECMYIIVDGTVKVVGRDELDQKIDVCTFTRGAIIGELEFLHAHNNVADVVALSDEVRVARLGRQHFELCMGPVKDILKSSREHDPVYDYYNRKRASIRVPHSMEEEEEVLVPSIVVQQHYPAHTEDQAEVKTELDTAVEVTKVEVTAVEQPPVVNQEEQEAAGSTSTGDAKAELADETQPEGIDQEEKELKVAYEIALDEVRAMLRATEQELVQCRRERQNLEVALHEANRSCLRIESEALMRIRQLEQELEHKNQELTHWRRMAQVPQTETSLPSPYVQEYFQRVSSPTAPTLYPRGPSWSASPTWSSSNSPRPSHACRLPGCRLCQAQASGRVSY